MIQQMLGVQGDRETAVRRFMDDYDLERKTIPPEASMKYSEARMGRIFTIRLEDGDVVHEAVEKLAGEESIQAGALVILGGGDRTSRLVAHDPAPGIGP